VLEPDQSGVNFADVNQARFLECTDVRTWRYTQNRFRGRAYPAVATSLVVAGSAPSNEMNFWNAAKDETVTEQARRAFGAVSANVFYTNPDVTLRPGALYIAGQNPGGDPRSIPSQREDTPLDHPQRRAERPDWCKFLDEGWDTHYRENVKYMVGKTLAGGVPDLRQAFCTNALFMRGALSRHGIDLDGLWAACRPWHIRWLTIVQPRAVLCLGNGDGASSYAWFTSLLSDVRELPGVATYNNFRLKIARGLFNGREVTLIGTPNPSRWSASHATSAEALSTIRQVLRSTGYGDGRT
jgi:hypothetical protein